jgi:hypothetical protein
MTEPSNPGVTPTDRLPQPGDAVLLGLASVGSTTVCAIPRNRIEALVQNEGYVNTVSIDSEGVVQVTPVLMYGVLATGRITGVLVFQNPDPVVRDQWMRDNAAAWLA